MRTLMMMLLPLRVLAIIAMTALALNRTETKNKMRHVIFWWATLCGKGLIYKQQPTTIVPGHSRFVSIYLLTCIFGMMLNQKTININSTGNGRGERGKNNARWTIPGNTEEETMNLLSMTRLLTCASYDCQ